MGGKRIKMIYKFYENNRIGFVDKNGEVVTSPKFKSVEDFHEGYARYTWEFGCGYISEEGNITQLYCDCYNFSEGLVVIKINSSYGFITKDFQIKIPPTYENAGNFHDGLAAVKIRGKWGFINNEGDIVIEPQFVDSGRKFLNNYTFFSDEVAPVKINACDWIFINKMGKRVFEKVFEDASEFINGFSIVKNHGKYGIIDLTGEYIVDPLYESMDLYIKDGYDMIAVSKDVKYGFIDFKGKIILPIEYDYCLNSMKYGQVCIYKDEDCEKGMWTFVSKDGNLLTEFIFDFIGEFNCGVAPVVVKDQYGVIDETGNFVI